MTTPTPTPQQRQIFNPGPFGSQAPTQDSSSQRQGQDDKGYPTVDDTTRNQVRKLLFESFSADKPLDGAKFSEAEIVDQLENDIFQYTISNFIPKFVNSSLPIAQKCKEGSKSKQYRDVSRAVQIKVKGPRFEHLRRELRLGNISAESLCSDDPSALPQTEQKVDLQQKSSYTNQGLPTQPQFRPPFGATGPQMFRPRPMGGPMFRPPIARPPMGQQIVPQIQPQTISELIHPQQEHQDKNKAPEIINQQHQEINKLDERKPLRSNQTSEMALNQEYEIEEEVTVHKELGSKQLKKAESEFISAQEQSRPIRPIETRSEYKESPKQQVSETRNLQPQQQPIPPPFSKQVQKDLQGPPLNIQKTPQQVQVKEEQHNQSLKPFVDEQTLNDESEIQRQKAMEQFNKELEQMQNNSTLSVDDSKDQVKKAKKSKKKSTKALKKDKKKSSKNQEDKSILEQVNQSHSLIVEQEESAETPSMKLLQPVKQQSETKQKQQSRKVSEEEFKYPTIQNDTQNLPQVSILTTYNAFGDNQANNNNQQEQQQKHEQVHVLSQYDRILEEQREEIENNNNQNNQLSGANNNSEVNFNNNQGIDERDYQTKNQIQLGNNQIQEDFYAPPQQFNAPQAFQSNQINKEINESNQIHTMKQQNPAKQEEEKEYRLDTNEDTNILTDQKSPTSYSRPEGSPLQKGQLDFQDSLMVPTIHVENHHSQIIQDDSQNDQFSSRFVIKNSQPRTGGGRAQSVKSGNSMSQQNGESENVKRLQESLTVQKEMNKEMKDKLILSENDSLLQGKKAQLMMEENKQMRDENKQLQRDLYNNRTNDEQALKQTIAQMKKLEVENKEKSNQLEIVQKELFRIKEEKDNYKDKFNKLVIDSQHHRDQLEKTVKALQNRPQQFVGVAQQHQLQNNDNLASNQQEQIENVQKEMNEMKQHYEAIIREKNQELSNRMKDLQRVERQNVQLQQKNSSLNGSASQLRDQVLSTIAGSGSNQRDTQALQLSQRRNLQLLGGLGGGFNSQPDAEEEEENALRLYNVGEDEGTGGDVYNQARNQNNFDYGYQEEGAVAVGGGLIGEEEEGYDYNEDNNNLRGRGNGAQQNMLMGSGQQQLTQQEAVGGQNDEEEDDLEDDDEEDDYEYEGEFEADGGDDEFDDGGGMGSGGVNEYDNSTGIDGQQLQSSLNNRQGGIHHHQEREGGATRMVGGSSGQTQQQQYSTNFQIEEGGSGLSDMGAYAAGGQYNQPTPAQRQANEERKQQQQRTNPGNKAGRRRGNRQQNQQQHNNVGGSSNTQNPKPNRNTRGRQQRSNQQHVNPQTNPNGQQQQQVQSTNEIGQLVPQPTSNQSSTSQQQQFRQGGGSSQNNQNQSSNLPQQEYFQSYGDSSSVIQFSRVTGVGDQSSNLPSSQSTQNQSSHQIQPSHQHHHQNVSGSGTQNAQSVLQGLGSGSGGVAGPGVVHTVGRGGQQHNNVGSVESMAESGSTASFLDKNQHTHKSTNQQQYVRPPQQHTQNSSQASVFQTGSNNNQFNSATFDQHQQQPSTSEIHFGSEQDIIGAAVGAPTQNKAAAQVRNKQQQQQQHQVSHQAHVGGSNNQQYVGSAYQVEESKQSSGEQPVFYNFNHQNNNQQQMTGNSGSAGLIPTQQQIPRNNNSLQTFYVGGSGEQEEDSSSFFTQLGNQSNLNSVQSHQPHYQAQTQQTPYGSGADFYRQPQPNNKMKGNTQSQQQQHLHQEQSSTPTRNDSRKTSGANTPNKDGADTPTTKNRNQQPHNTYVHNLTSNQLFFSNQDENEGGQGFQQQQHQSNFDAIPSNMFE